LKQPQGWHRPIVDDFMDERRMHRFRDELRITVRTLAKARGFTVAVVATLGVALALETTIVSTVNAYLLRSLPYPGADRLYQVQYAALGESAPDGLEALAWGSLSDVIEYGIAWDLDVFYMTGGDHAERAPGAWVTRDFMEGLNIRPAIGRAFVPDEFERGGPQVALISNALWQTRFGGDPSIVGKQFNAYVSDRPEDPEAFTIVGVMPASFWHLNPYTSILTPLRGAATYPYMVRLRSGVAPSLAERRIAELVLSSGARVPPGWRPLLTSAQNAYTRSVKPLLLAIGAAVTLVLLIACSNVTLLLLLRGIRRDKEIAVRLALGASRGEVARMLVAESTVLCAMGVVLGTALAAILNRLLAPMIEQQLGRRIPGGPSAVAIDLKVSAIVLVVALVIAAIMSLAPILLTRRGELFATLRSARGGGGGRSARGRAMLVTIEVAGSFALLVGCGLMVRTIRSMLSVDLGIQSAHVTEASLALREQSYPTAHARAVFYERVLAEVRRAPGVAVAALSGPSPSVSFEARPIRAESNESAIHRAPVRTVAGEYFRALGIPIIQGRALGDQDREGGPPVVVISESLARRLWPNGAAVGSRVRMVERGALREDTATILRTVVGVVRDVRQTPTDAEIADAYIPLAQAADRYASIVVQSTVSSAEWSAALRRLMKGVDPDVNVDPAIALAQIVDAQLSRPRFLASAFAAFGVFASLLGVMGLYVVIAYAVKQREHEVAIRMAVGADPRRVFSLFVKDAGRVLALGIALGVLAAAGIGRLLSTQLFGVARVDAVTLITTALVLITACLVAVWRPARRAARIDPVVVLRAE
jgi:putative ABC transport system permease protein